jgi:DNA primase
MANIQMPCICLQGEGYPISDTAIKELRKRFTDIYVCLDNDETGLRDAEKLAEKHQLINVVIPQFEGGKDISDYYKLYKQKSFRELFIQLFIQTRNNWYEKHT